MAETRARLLVAFPQFRVADLVRTAEFYRDVLGFQLDGFFGDPPVFTHARRDFVVIQLGNLQEAEGATRPPGGVAHNAYLWTDQVDALAIELRAAGADIVDGPVTRPYAARELIVRDCNGLILCFAQRLPASA